MSGRPATLKELRERTTGGQSSRVDYLTQEEVADQAGIDRPIYNQLERGGATRKLTRTYAERLAPILGDGVWLLVEETERHRRSLEERVALLEEALDALGTDLAALASLPERVLALEQQAQPKTRRAAAKKTG